MANSTTSGLKTYTGHGQAGNLADPANWSGSGGINAGSITLVPIDATINGTVTVAQMMLLGDEAVTVNGTLNTQWLGPCKGFMVCNDAVATFAPAATLNDAGGFIVGIDETGTLLAEGHAGARSTLNTGAGKIGRFAGSHGIVTIDGGVWHDAQGMLVGECGSGMLMVTHGGLVTEGSDLVVASQSGASGTIDVLAGGTMRVAANARIGSAAGSGPAGAGTLSVGAGGAFAAGGFLRVMQGSTLTLAGGVVSEADLPVGMQVLAGAAMSGYGTVTAAGGFHVDGIVLAAGGTLLLNGSLLGHGALQIAAGATACVNGATIGALGIAFMGADASLMLSHGVNDHAAISGFAVGDSIAMAGIDHLDWNAATDVLTLSEGGHAVDKLHFAGTYAGGFDLSQSGGMGMITVHVPTH